ncbi:MAG TPA: PBP1A family penicillin-binding protein [Longimicrobiales bacterium]|nr:PBP1A family penicillin-binding protein [Longimicrobiales bacterium]
MRMGRGGVVLGAAIAGLMLVAAGLALVVAWTTCGLRGCPDIELLQGYMPDEASVVVDRNGEPVGSLYLVRRVLVPLDSVPEHVAAAFIAAEDRRFWEHSGVDWRRIPGAAWRNLQARRIEEGFSTITMQLARNLFPDALPAEERTVARKLGEMRVAMEIEERYGKQEILELYLNQIYFGSGAWGIEAAAREFFGKSASQLTLAEGAMLAGVPVAPSVLNPRAAPEAAKRRRSVVLSRMVAAGLITAEEARVAAEEPVHLSRSDWIVRDEAPYFLEAVRQEMEQVLGRALYTRGLTIHATIDLDVQRIAERELLAQLERIESGAYGTFRHPRYSQSADVPEEPSGRTPYLQGAVVVMELATGGVLAMVGGRDFNDSRYNRALQAWRQPGSAFKPVVYAAALEEGIPPTHRLADTPYSLRLAGGQVWAPTNYGGGYSGQVTLRDALRLSKNVPTVRLADEVGLSRVIGMARQLGLSGRIPEVPSVVLGAAEVTLMELVTAYTPFATLGDRVEPRLVTHVEDRNGNVVWRSERETRRVLDPAVAFLVTDILRDVVNRGTGTAVRAAGYRGPAAGKTGTTNDATDVWFVGFTPAVAAGVWIGMDRPRTVVAGATGGVLAAPVWGRVVRALGESGQDWAPPPGVMNVRVDVFGDPVPNDCPPMGPTRTEFILRGTVAVESCHDYLTRPRDQAWPGGPELLGEELWWRLRREELERSGRSPDAPGAAGPDGASDGGSPADEPGPAGTEPSRRDRRRGRDDDGTVDPDASRGRPPVDGRSPDPGATGGRGPGANADPVGPDHDPSPVDEPGRNQPEPPSVLPGVPADSMDWLEP